MAGVVGDPEEVAGVTGAEKGKAFPSLGGESEGVAVVGVVSVLLLRISATEELATGDIDVASVASLVETDRSTGPPGDVVGGSTEFPSVVVTPSVEGLVGVGALSGSGVEVVVAVMFKVAVVCVWSVVAEAKGTADTEIAELRASNTSVGPPTPLVPRAFPPSNSEVLCTEDNSGMCDGPLGISLPVLVAIGEVGGISVDVLVAAGRLALLSANTSSEGGGVRVSCGG